jgi:glyoxylase-like metal-dependent hydrolase (beta-lactamase superfamily II)
MSNRNKYLLQSVENSLRVLEAFREEEPELGISELARKLGLSRSSVYRIVATLTARGFLAQETANGKYRLGLGAYQAPEQTYAAQLAKWGYEKEDIGAILHTHLHIDHAGNDPDFPNAKIIMPRRELMFAVADLMDAQYPPEYITYLVEQIHVPGKVRLIDDDGELVPGIFLEITEGHTWGSMNIKVNTAKGLAIICGDVIYDEQLQCRANPVFAEIAAHNQYDMEPFGDRSTGNYWNLWAAKAAVQKVMREADVILPIHDALVLEKYGYEI